MPEYNAFFYGTLMAPQVLRRVIYNMPHTPAHLLPALLTSPAILHDHRRHRVANADYPAVVPAPGSSVRGVFVTGLTSANMLNLDLFEGGDYERRVVTAHLLKTMEEALTGEGNLGGAEVTAETYIWVGGKERLEDQEWDFADFQKDKLRYWADGDVYGEFEALDNAIAAQQDDSTGGNGANTPTAQALQPDHDEEAEEKKKDEPLKSAV